jgi:aryl-alcohol dehydrogenase-like predicted oxidoreductase
MQTRRFGRTNHASTVAIFGAAALWSATQAGADAVMEQIIAAGVNHIDVAPSYGLAEERIGPWMPRMRGQFFLGCKTMARDAAGAAAELRRSLERLQVDAFDLYQIHAVETLAELDAATRQSTSCYHRMSPASARLAMPGCCPWCCAPASSSAP